MPCPIITFTRPARCYDTFGSLKQLKHTNSYTEQMSFASPNANGDRLQMFFYARGTEVELNISTYKYGDAGIWDLYVNGVLDSSGYDDYAAGHSANTRRITLTERIRRGYNVIEVRVNGKNASSSGYVVGVHGASIQ